MNSCCIRSLARKMAPQAAKMTTHMQARSFVSVTPPLFEKTSVKVPTMGDSITEGTIVEWTAAVGQKVEEGDVVALVETDKVTVDIKADITGVITQQFGAVDDTVEVGADLYEIDTEAEATVTAETSAKAPAEDMKVESASESSPPQAKPAAVSAAPAAQPQPSRSPSIKFLGKDGWLRVRMGVPELPPVPPKFGRPTFSEEEMEALLTGGANLVPEVKEHSAGAIFG